MAALWKDEYKIGVDKIDEQHRQLFDKIENLLEIAKNGDRESNRRECLKVIDFLIYYTGSHFDTEENFQRERRYVSYAQHVKIHENFKNTVSAYRELLNVDFSARTLKSFIGTLITWLVNHVCVCDRKIAKNIPLLAMETFADADSFIKNVAQRLLTDMYGIPILETKSCIYKGSVDGAVIIRLIASGSRRHMFLYGMSQELAGVMYNKISGMSLADIGCMDEIERSAFLEIGGIITAYAMSAIEENGRGIGFKRDLYIREYTETEYNISNSVILEIKTGVGEMDILYCPLK